jgi:hypothetical protein
MGIATEEYWVSVLDEGVRLLRRSGCPYLVIGSLATGFYIGNDWNPSHDIDFFIPRARAESMLAEFEGAGFSSYRKDERWLFKVARPNVTIDLIFLASYSIELDEELMHRSAAANFKGVELRIAAPEDLIVMKAIADSPDFRGNWYESLGLVERGGIDWDYLEHRSLTNGPERLLAFLLYARTAGVEIPERTVKVLAGEVLP